MSKKLLKSCITRALSSTIINQKRSEWISNLLKFLGQNHTRTRKSSFFLFSTSISKSRLSPRFSLQQINKDNLNQPLRNQTRKREKKQNTSKENLLPITNRATMPFSSSIFFNMAPITENIHEKRLFLKRNAHLKTNLKIIIKVKQIKTISKRKRPKYHLFVKRSKQCENQEFNKVCWLIKNVVEANHKSFLVNKPFVSRGLLMALISETKNNKTADFNFTCSHPSLANCISLIFAPKACQYAYYNEWLFLRLNIVNFIIFGNKAFFFCSSQLHMKGWKFLLLFPNNQNFFYLNMKDESLITIT